jgi:Protein of unknown function, DUF481
MSRGGLERRRGWRTALLFAAIALVTTTALADDVTSKGTVLKGKVTGLSADGLTFEPEYGKGSLAIDWKDVEDVKTEGPMQVLYGDGLEADAPLQGFSDGKVLVGGAAETATAVPIADLHSAVAIGPDGLTWQDEMRSYFRYWDGSADLGLNLQQSTTDTFGFLIGMQTTRTNAPTRLILGADYRYSTQQQNNQKKQTIEDRAFGSIRGEYDIIDRLYGFGAGDATYDAIQKLSIRAVPKAGLGYTVWEEKLAEAKRNFLALEAGGAWVYEKYFGSTCRNAGVTIPGCDTENNYFAVAFGAAAAYNLPYGALIGGRVDYLPAVDDFVNDYLLRSALELSAPIVGPVSAKFSLLNEYDNTPAKGTTYNSLYLAFGLSVGW